MSALPMAVVELLTNENISYQLTNSGLRFATPEDQRKAYLLLHQRNLHLFLPKIITPHVMVYPYQSVSYQPLLEKGRLYKPIRS